MGSRQAARCLPRHLLFDLVATAELSVTTFGTFCASSPPSSPTVGHLFAVDFSGSMAANGTAPVTSFPSPPDTSARYTQVGRIPSAGFSPAGSRRQTPQSRFRFASARACCACCLAASNCWGYGLRSEVHLVRRLPQTPSAACVLCPGHRIGPVSRADRVERVQYATGACRSKDLAESLSEQRQGAGGDVSELGGGCQVLDRFDLSRRELLGRESWTG